MSQVLKLYKDLLFYTLIAIVIGVIDAIFGKGLIWLSNIRNENPTIWIPLLPLGGIVIIVLYLRFSKEALKGMTLIFQTGLGENEIIPKRLIHLSIISTWITHLFGGSAGREGVSVQLGATVAHLLGKRIDLKKKS